MKRKNFLHDLKIDDAIQDGINEFNKESGYPVKGSSKSKVVLHTATRSTNQHKSNSDLKIVKFFSILRNLV